MSEVEKNDNNEEVHETEPVNIVVTGLSKERERIKNEIKNDVLRRLASMGIEAADQAMMREIMSGVFSDVLSDFAEFGYQTQQNGRFNVTMMHGQDAADGTQSSSCVAMVIYGPNAIEIANSVGSALGAQEKLKEPTPA